MINHMVRQIKEVIPRHNVAIFSLVTLSGDAKTIEERLREEMPDMEVTVDVGVGIGNGGLAELIVRCKRKEHFPTLMWEGR